MNSTLEKDSMNEVYDAVLITVGALGISMASKKIIKEPLATPESVKGFAKLAVAVSVSTLLVRLLQRKKYLPADPFGGDKKNI